MAECKSAFDIGGEIIKCSGEHLHGNPFRDDGIVHTWKSESGTIWTWRTGERYSLWVD